MTEGGKAGIVCAQCEQLVSLKDTVRMAGGEVWFTCTNCDHRERLVPKDGE